MFDLQRAWNCNMRLKAAVRRASADGISKDTVVNFWKSSAKNLGYYGSYPVVMAKSRRAMPTSGAYAEWKGLSGAGKLLRDIIDGERA